MVTRQFTAEIIDTFALVFIGAGGLAGVALAFAILMGGPLTGASLNPARTLGPALFTGTLGQFWIYLIGAFTGAAAAMGVFRMLKVDR